MQDLPPKEGFTPLSYKRNLPSKGFSGAIILSVITGVVLGGILLQRKSIEIIQELDREKIQSRLQLLPLLQAETDRQTLSQELKLLELQRMARERGFEETGEPIYHNKNNYIKGSFSL